MSTRPAAGPGCPPPAAAWALLAAAGLVLGGGLLWVGLRDRRAFIHPKADAWSEARLESAITAARQKLKDDPQDIRAMVDLGVLNFRKGKDSYLEAINLLEEARALGALDVRIFYCLGMMYQELGLYPFALSEYRRFLRNRPDDKEVRLLAAKLLYQQGQFLEAAGEYERIKFQDPEDLLVQENLGLSLWRAGNPEGAGQVFSGLLQAEGAPALRAGYYLGQIRLEKGDAQGALEGLLKAAENRPEQLGLPEEEVYSALGAAYQKLGKGEEARQAWQRVLALAPKQPKASAALREINRKFPVKKASKK